MIKSLKEIPQLTHWKAKNSSQILATRARAINKNMHSLKTKIWVEIEVQCQTIMAKKFKVISLKKINLEK